MIPHESESRNADDCIKKHAILAGVAGLIPLPVADIAGVGAVQVKMIQQLAVIYKAPLNIQVIKQLIMTMLGAELTQTLFSSIASALKGIPGPGTLVGEAIQGMISCATTFAIGKAAKFYLSSQQLPDPVALQQAYKNALQEGRDFARDSVGNSPSDPRLVSELEEIHASLAENLGKDVDFIEKLSQYFSQFRGSVEQEAEIDQELNDILDQARTRRREGDET